MTEMKGIAAQSEKPLEHAKANSWPIINTVGGEKLGVAPSCFKYSFTEIKNVCKLNT